jgi:hypothetical protein
MPYRVVYRDADGVVRETFVPDPEEEEYAIRDGGGEFIFSEWLEADSSELPGYEPPPLPQDSL